MKHTHRSPWRDYLTLLILPTLLIGALALGGCSNDSVAPQDEVPALSVDEVANQAGWVAMATGIVGPQTVEFTAKSDKNSYEYAFTGNVAGVVHLDFFSGGAGGTSATPSEADYVDLYTADGAPLVITVGIEGLEGTILLTFAMAADLDRAADPDEATINGGGTFASGPYAASFEFNGVVVGNGSSYPSAGTMVFTGSGFVMTVTFDGDNTANLLTGDGQAYTIDLDTGEVTEALVPQ